MKTHLFAPGLLLLTLAACGSTPQETAANADGKICQREIPTGTSIAVTRCRTPEEIEEERRRTATELDRVRNNPGSTSTTGR